MPRFSFRVSEAKDPRPAFLDLPNLNAARVEAVKAACTLLGDSPDDFWSSGGDWQMTVTDERGLTLFTLIFYAANAPAGSAGSFNVERRPS